jgi:tetratricopeptide (TPR) repeat protein
MRILIVLMILAGPAVAEWAERYSNGVALLEQHNTVAAGRELSSALKEAQMAGEHGQGLVAILDALGQVEFRSGNYSDAKHYFERALHVSIIREPANEAAVLGNTGQACLALGQYRQAERYFREGIRLMPQTAVLWHGLGQAMLLDGRHAEAEDAFRRALGERDSSPVIWSDLAALLEARNRREEALALFRKAAAATAAGQNRARVLRNVAVLEWKTGARSLALDHWREALTELEAVVGPEHPDVAQVLKDYSKALAETGDKRRSREAAQRAASILSAFVGQDEDGTIAWQDLRRSNTGARQAGSSASAIPEPRAPTSRAGSR